MNIKMSCSRFKLITFDVTGTILQFRYPIGKLYCDIGASFGVKCNEDKLMHNFKKEWKNMVMLHPNFGQKDIGWRKWWTTIVYNCFKEFDVDEQKGQLLAKTLIKKFETMDCWKVTDNAIDLLEYLKCRKVCLGVLSNFDDRIEPLLCNAGLRNHFNFITNSYKAGYAKPDINIFKCALAQSQLTNVCPSDCLHIGDNLQLDYCGAKNAGWNAMLISNNHDLNADIPDKEVFCDFNHLAMELLKLV